MKYLMFTLMQMRAEFGLKYPVFLLTLLQGEHETEVWLPLKLFHGTEIGWQRSCLTIPVAGMKEEGTLQHRLMETCKHNLQPRLLGGP